jgi:hypothetical protein
MTASYPTSVKAFTTKADGTTPIEASHINDLQDEVVAIETQLITDTFTEVTSFSNSWVNYGSGYDTAGYYKDAYGYVHLKGLLKNGTITLTMFTLPAGYRPAYRYLFATLSNDALGRCDIDTSGNVIAVTGNTAWISINGLVFLAEA